MADTKTITLRKPLTYGKGDDAKTVTEITVREPTAGEYEQAEKSGGVYGWQVALVAIVSGTPIDVIDGMYESQLDEAADFVAQFGQSALTAGGKSDPELDYALTVPVKITEDDNPANVATLSLSEPTNQQRRKANEAGGPFAANVALISAVARVPKIAVRRLVARDFLAVTAFFNGFQYRRAPDSDD